MTLELITIRLSYIKHLYKLGVDQSKQPETIAYSSILLFHDSIDMFLQLVAEVKGITKRNKTFMMDFFSLIPELTMAASVKKINERRNSLKHNGQIPAKVEVEESEVICRLFFEQNAIALLNIPFDEVSIINVIKYDSIRNFLIEAEKLIRDGETIQAAISVAKAFYEVMHIDEDFRYEHRHELWHNRVSLSQGSYQNVTKDLWNTPYSDLGKQFEKHDRYLKSVIETYDQNFDYIHEALNVVSLGIDYRRYRWYTVLMPTVTKYRKDGDYVIDPYYKAEKLDTKTLLALKDFVFEAAMKLQDSEV